MGQLDILAAHSVATERQTAVSRELHHRQVAGDRTATLRPATRRIPTLLARLGLDRRPAAA